jgi:hypothetical protein
MNCFVCGQEAEDISRPDFDGVSIRCPECEDYDISMTALSILMQNPGASDALEKAKRLTPPGQRPMITTRHLG